MYLINTLDGLGNHFALDGEQSQLRTEWCSTQFLGTLLFGSGLELDRLRLGLSFDNHSLGFSLCNDLGGLSPGLSIADGSCVLGLDLCGELLRSSLGFDHSDSRISLHFSCGDLSLSLQVSKSVLSLGSDDSLFGDVVGQLRVHDLEALHTNVGDFQTVCLLEVVMQTGNELVVNHVEEERGVVVRVVILVGHSRDGLALSDLVEGCATNNDLECGSGGFLDQLLDGIGVTNGEDGLLGIGNSVEDGGLDTDLHEILGIATKEVASSGALAKRNRLLASAQEIHENSLSSIEDVLLGLQDVELSVHVADTDLTIVYDNALSGSKLYLLLASGNALDECEVGAVDLVDVGLVNKDGLVVVPGKTNLTITDSVSCDGSVDNVGFINVTYSVECKNLEEIIRLIQ